MASSEEPPLAAVGARGDHGGERLTLRQARVLEVLALAGGPLSGEAIGARLGVRAGSLSVTGERHRARWAIADDGGGRPRRPLPS